MNLSISRVKTEPPSKCFPHRDNTRASSICSRKKVRPALPIVSTDPAVVGSDLPSGLEGNVIVEITIDEAGNVVERSVIQSLTPVIDGKVLAAVEKWHFRPATRDGVAIASKQDVYYHFPASAQQLMAR